MTIKEEIIDSDYDDPPTPSYGGYTTVQRNILPNPISLQPRLAVRQNIFSKSAQLQAQKNLRQTNGPLLQDQPPRGEMEGTFLRFKGFRYYRDGLNFDKKTQTQKVYWRCCAYKRNKCKARLHTDLSNYVLRVGVPHLMNCKDMYPRQV